MNYLTVTRVRATPMPMDVFEQTFGTGQTDFVGGIPGFCVMHPDGRMEWMHEVTFRAQFCSEDDALASYETLHKLLPKP